MGRKLINFIILLPLGILLVLFSVANRTPVSLALNPFDPADKVLSVTAPFFVYLLIAFIIGLVAGSLATWFSQGKHRKRAKSHRREAVAWQSEADKQKSRADEIAGLTSTAEKLPAP
ncbi:LapA family protein [Martelella alba]|uniref:LapA family protein n=1 Tax=Martelella alba TaxID=2590451 RepID=A0A506U2P5_9HYPH|nr:LapA family protein [Martelella alba]TPW28070.1 LapA family protein [Martelella alba]